MGEISFIMMQDRNGIVFPRRAHAGRKSQTEILRDAENHCGGARQSNQEEDARPAKHFTSTLTFHFYLFPSVLSEGAPLRELGRSSC